MRTRYLVTGIAMLVASLLLSQTHYADDTLRYVDWRIEPGQEIQASHNDDGTLVMVQEGSQATLLASQEEIQNLESGSQASPTDPDLETGFPVQAWHSAGSHHAGPAIHALVANIDSDPELEIVTTALSTGPVYAWNFDGTQVTNWPITGSNGAGYPAAGNLSTGANVTSGIMRDVFIGFMGLPGTLGAYRNGIVMTGWPKSSANYVATPGALANVVDNGADEIFLEEEDWKLHGYFGDGTLPTGWPASESSGGQERHTPAIADLDGDGDLEIVTCSGSTTPGVYLFAYHHDGTTVTGFPILVYVNYGFPDTFPAIGDVDGDGDYEIVVLTRNLDGGYATCKLKVFSADGSFEREMVTANRTSYGSAPALADLDDDGFPEIVVQTDGSLDVFKGDGTSFPGWPVNWSASEWLGNSSPAVGDVDGDGEQDIVVTSQVAGSSVNGDVRVYSKNGALHASFPKSLPMGSGAVPAIADFDLDGRNEVIVVGAYWNGASGNYDKVWVYDLQGGTGYGGIEWGQLGGGPSHQGFYKAKKVLKRILEFGPNSAFPH